MQGGGGVPVRGVPAAGGVVGPGARVHRPAKVGDLEGAVPAHEQVLGLDVPVDDVLGVAVPEGLGELPDAARGAGLAQAAAARAARAAASLLLLPLRRPPLQLAVELPPGRVLQDQVHPFGVVEVPEQPEHVAVPEVALDLDLAPQLVLDLRRAQLAFEEDFEGDDVAALALPREVDAAKLALAQGATDVKVREGPGRRRRGGRGRERGARAAASAKEQGRRRQRLLLPPRLLLHLEDSVACCCCCGRGGRGKGERGLFVGSSPLFYGYEVRRESEREKEKREGESEKRFFSTVFFLRSVSCSPRKESRRQTLQPRPLSLTLTDSSPLTLESGGSTNAPPPGVEPAANEAAWEVTATPFAPPAVVAAESGLRFLAGEIAPPLLLLRPLR